MASEERGNRDNGTNVVTSDDITAMIRGDESSRSEKSEVDQHVESEGREPEVGSADDDMYDTPERRQRAKLPESDDETAQPDARALNVIDRLTEDNRLLRERVDAASPRSEPAVEFVEFAPGIKLPKDTSTWPVRLTDEVMKSVGIDPGENGQMTKAFNILGNALFMMAVDATSRGAAETIERTTTERERGRAHFNAFYNAFPDLKGAEDLVGTEEARARQQGLHQRGLTDARYAAEIATRTRARLAQFRGQSLDQYLGSVQNNGARQQGSNVNTRTPGRARFGGSSAMVPRDNRRMSPNQREFEDMFNG